MVTTEVRGGLVMGLEERKASVFRGSGFRSLRQPQPRLEQRCSGGLVFRAASGGAKLVWGLRHGFVEMILRGQKAELR